MAAWSDWTGWGEDNDEEEDLQGSGVRTTLCNWMSIN